MLLTSSARGSGRVGTDHGRRDRVDKVLLVFVISKKDVFIVILGPIAWISSSSHEFYRVRELHMIKDSIVLDVCHKMTARNQDNEILGVLQVSSEASGNDMVHMDGFIRTFRLGKTTEVDDIFETSELKRRQLFAILVAGARELVEVGENRRIKRILLNLSNYFDRSSTS